MPFKLSRSNSRARSAEILSTVNDDFLNDDVLENPELSNMNLNLTDREYKNLYKNADKQTTFHKAALHPLGRTIIKLVNHHNKSLNDNDPGIDLEEVCTAFDTNMQLNVKDVQKLIDESNQELKKNIYQKDLSFHLLNPRFKPPSNFSPINVLNSPHKATEALKLFPSHSKSKFSGINKDGPNLAEFLYTIEYAQERLNLSETEFKQKLLTSLTGPAHETIRNLVEQGDSIPSLYHALTSMYDNSPDPIASKSALAKMKISRRSNLYAAQNKILSLANSAARLFKDGPIRKTIANTEACQTLIRALPPNSSKFVRTKFNEFLTTQTEVDKDPLFVDFVRFLNKYQDDINEDIKLNGSNYEDKDYKDLKENNFRDNRDRRYSNQTTTFRPYRPLRVQTTYAYPPAPAWSIYNKRFEPYPQATVRAINNNYASQNKFLNKLYCSLCGKTNHTSAQGCYAIKKNGVVVPCAPTQIPCNICEKLTGKKLFHPVALCFNKDKQDKFQTKANYQNKSNGRY